jgi:hypothetical protein
MNLDLKKCPKSVGVAPTAKHQYSFFNKRKCKNKENGSIRPLVPNR